MTEPDTKPIDELDIAVVHGNYLAHGGGEVVAEAIAETFDAPIYYGFGDPDAAIPDSTVEHRCLFEDVPRMFHRLCDRPMVRDAGFFRYGQHLPEIADYDVVIQSGNEFAWYPPPDGQTVVRYVHSPPRGAFDQFQNSGGGIIETLVQTAIRTLFEPTNTYHDTLVANSDLVKRRCQRYWGRDASVVYPPVDVGSFHSAPGDQRGDYYLTLSRLSENKRIGEIVEAFTQLGEPLKVAGDGPLRDELEAAAGPNVEFRGYVDEDEKRDLLAHARAFVFNARDEDFGLVPVEAMAAGCPVLGVDEGFTGHQIVDGWSGYTYPSESRVNFLRETVRRFEREGVTATPHDIRGFAMDHFDVGRFREQMRSEVAAAVDDARVTVPWQDVAAGDDSEVSAPGVAVTDGGSQ